MSASLARANLLPPRSRAGFTLIELMIAVAVVALLAVIAYPSYTEHLRKGRRATAQSVLMDIASKQQAYLLDRRAYAAALADLSFGAPSEIDAAYSFTLAVDNAATPMTFVATATPRNAQAVNGEQRLTIDQSGAKTPANTTGYWGK